MAWNLLTFWLNEVAFRPGHSVGQEKNLTIWMMDVGFWFPVEENMIWESTLLCTFPSQKQGRVARPLTTTIEAYEYHVAIGCGRPTEVDDEAVHGVWWCGLCIWRASFSHYG